MLCLPPHLPRHLHHQLQLRDLIFNRQLVAEHGAGKAALWTDAELVQRNELARFIDAALEIVGLFQRAGFRSHQPKNQLLAFGQVAQRHKVSRARRVCSRRLKTRRGEPRDMPAPVQATSSESPSSREEESPFTLTYTT